MLQKIHKKICLYCKNDFDAYDKRRKFCSTICANRNNKMFGEKNPKAKNRKFRKEIGRKHSEETKKKISESLKNNLI